MLLTKLSAIRDIAKETGRTRAEVKELIEALLGKIEDTLASGGRVEFRDFGTWETRISKSRMGRNPSNPGAGDIFIPARPTLRFRTGKKLQIAVNQIASLP